MELIRLGEKMHLVGKPVCLVHKTEGEIEGNLEMLSLVEGVGELTIGGRVYGLKDFEENLRVYLFSPELNYYVLMEA